MKKQIEIKNNMGQIIKNRFIKKPEVWEGGKTALDGHKEKLNLKYEQWKLEQKNTNEHSDIKILMQTSGIKCKKYNYTFDKKPQPNHDALVRLSLDEKELIINHQILTLDPAGPDFSKVPPIN